MSLFLQKNIIVENLAPVLFSRNKTVPLLFSCMLLIAESQGEHRRIIRSLMVTWSHFQPGSCNWLLNDFSDVTLVREEPPVISNWSIPAGIPLHQIWLLHLLDIWKHLSINVYNYFCLKHGVPYFVIFLYNCLFIINTAVWLFLLRGIVYQVSKVTP